MTQLPEPRMALPKEDAKELRRLILHLIRDRQVRLGDRSGMFGRARMPVISYLFTPYSEIPNAPLQEIPHARPQVVSTLLALRAIEAADLAGVIEPTDRPLVITCAEQSGNWLHGLIEGQPQSRRVCVEVERFSNGARTFDRIPSHYHTALALYALSCQCEQTDIDLTDYRVFADYADKTTAWSKHGGFLPYDSDDPWTDDDPQQWTPWPTCYLFLFTLEFQRITAEGLRLASGQAWEWLKNYCLSSKLDQRHLAQHVVRCLLQLLDERLSPKQLEDVFTIVQAIGETLPTMGEWEAKDVSGPAWSPVRDGVTAYQPYNNRIVARHLDVNELIAFEYELTYTALFWLFYRTALNLAHDVLKHMLDKKAPAPPLEWPFVQSLLDYCKPNYDKACTSREKMIHKLKNFGLDLVDSYDVSYLVLLQLWANDCIHKADWLMETALRVISARLDPAKSVFTLEAFAAISGFPDAGAAITAWRAFCNSFEELKKTYDTLMAERRGSGPQTIIRFIPLVRSLLQQMESVPLLSKSVHGGV